MSNQKPEIKNGKNSYLLRTQSTILKGLQTIPFNSIRSKTANKTNNVKNKINTPKKRFAKISSYNSSTKTKMPLKNEKDKSTGMIDLNRVSGRTFSSSHFKNKSYTKIIRPNESIAFSPKESNRKEEGGYQVHINSKKK